MKINDITEDQIEIARNIYWDRSKSWDERMKELIQFFGVSERTTRRWCVKLGFKENNFTDNSEQYKEAQNKVIDKSKKYYFITWAQNNTPIFFPFFKKLQAYASFHNAEIIVIAGRYSNKMETLKKDTKESWADELIPYLSATSHNLNNNVKVMSHIKVSATSSNPLMGLEGLTSTESIIIGHPRLHLKVMPVIDPMKPKMLFTTGACTKENYTDSLLGAKGDFNHTFGFCVVEVKDKDMFFVRQVSADSKTGEFTDLYYHVNDKGVSRINQIDGIVLGDLHVGEHNPVVIDKTLNILLKKLTPKAIVCHDSFSALSINPHELKDPFILAKREKDGTNSLKDEIDNMLNFFEKIKEYNVIIVRSNHDDMLDRFLKTDWRSGSTMKNSEEYMKFSLLTLTGKAKNGIIPYVINERFPNFKCLSRDDSYKIGNFEISQHGDLVYNNVKGGIEQFRKLNQKYIIGHSHTPSRRDGALSVGTSTFLKLSYTSGLTNWANSHVIISNGKAQHIIFVGENAEFTTFE